MECPVTAFTQYVKVRPPKRGQFFIKVDGNPINRGDLDNILHRLSEFHQHFKPHSLRIGGSSHPHLSGVPVHKIKEISRWSSDAFKKYIRVYVISLQWLMEFGSSETVDEQSV